MNYCPSIYEGKVKEAQLLKLVKFTPRNKHETEEFTIFCDPSFEINKYAKRSENSQVLLNRVSVIQYFSQTLGCIHLGQLIGIVCFDGEIHVLVSRLKEEDSQKTFKKLPYPLFKYAMEIDDSTRFAFEHVPIAHVVRPCFAIPAVDHENLNMTSIGSHHIKQSHISYFYVITIDRARLLDQLHYTDYLSLNEYKVPWDRRKGTDKCLNYNVYLMESEQEHIRDVLNA